MTIVVTQTRDNGELHQLPTFRLDSTQALVRLARVDLAWGAQVVELREDRIHVQARILACVDVSVFQGPVQEMKPLFDLVSYYMLASEKHGGLIEERVASECVRQLPQGSAQQTFIEMLMPMLAGENRLKVALMLACGLQDQADIEAGSQLSLENLAAVIELTGEEECSFREALELAV